MGLSEFTGAWGLVFTAPFRPMERTGKMKDALFRAMRISWFEGRELQNVSMKVGVLRCECQPHAEFARLGRYVYFNDQYFT